MEHGFHRGSPLPRMETILSILIPLTFFVMLFVEHRFPGRPLPKVRFWLLKGIVFFLFTGVVNAFVPAIVSWAFGTKTLFHLAPLGTIAGALLVTVVGDFINYWVHRAMHRVHFIWRWSHQVHHSAERMDLAGMAYAHPFDTAFVFIPIGLATALLGVSTDAAALGGFIGFVIGVVQHMNIKTPHWLGYIVQRPESHGLHHQRGVHAYNYANLPFWDMLFGTFRNPKDFPAEYGFWDGASKKFGSMLIGRDVGEPS